MKLGLSVLCVLPAVLLGTLHLNRQALAQPRPVQMAPASAGMPPMPAVVREEPAEVTEARLKWFRDARFGMFIHWGVYAVYAGSYRGKPVTAEWIENRARIPLAEYRAAARQFTASKYDPRAWAALMKDAGVKYAVITCKHHDGFALFDTAYSDWNAVKASGAARDLIAPLAAAVRRQGLRFGCYYSQSQDWTNPGGGKGNTQPWDEEQKKGSFDEYLKGIALPQVRELIEKFHPDVLWWDTEYSMTPERARPFFDLAISDPKLLINSRLGGGVLGDFRTSEQRIPAASLGGRALEVNMTINGSWGYRADDTNWKSAQTLIRNLSDIASKDGNYLLNVGPTAEGVIPQPEVDRLLAIGKWLKTNGPAIYATRGSPFPQLPEALRATVKMNPSGATTLYIHVWDWPAGGKVTLPGLKSAPRSGRLLAGGTAVKWELAPQGLVVSLPASAPDPDVSVFALEFAGPLQLGGQKGATP